MYYDKGLQGRPEIHNVPEDDVLEIGTDVFHYIPAIVPHVRYVLSVATQAERPTFGSICRLHGEEMNARYGSYSTNMNPQHQTTRTEVVAKVQQAY